MVDYIAGSHCLDNEECCRKTLQSQKLTDHWPVVTHVRLPHKKENWKYQSNSILRGWRPKTESDEAALGRMTVESLEDAEDMMGHLSIEDITKKLPMAARAFGFESTGGRNSMVRQTREHLEAEMNLKGTEGDKLKLPKESCPSKEGRTKPEVFCRRQKDKGKQRICHALYCERVRGTTSDRQKWKEELERYSRN